MSEPPSVDDRVQDVHRLLVEETRELLCLHDHEARFLFVSPSVQPLMGYSPEELLGTNPLDLVHGEDHPVYLQALQAVVEEEGSPILTSRIRRSDGSYIWVEVQTRGLRNSDGEVSRIITSTRDVSDRVELLERVSEREATVRSVITSFDDLVFVFDREGRFREYYQPRDRAGLFQSPEAFLGRRFDAVLPAAVSEPLGEALDLARAQRAVQDFDYQLMIDSTPRDFHAKVTPRIDDTGELRGFVGLVREITERRSAERVRLELVRTKERAERLEGLSTLARGTAHEFNNLLTTIQGNVALASEELEGSAIAEGLEDAIAATERAAELVQQLLRYAGESLRRLQPLDPAALLREIEEDLRTELPGSTRLEVEVAPGIPHIEADRTLLRSALQNLVRNAVDALAEEDGTVGIRLRSRALSSADLEESEIEPRPGPGDFVQFEVTDDGEGIDPEVRPHIFDPFLSTRFLGRGLGLAEVAGTARTHHGVIFVESRPEHGTSVRMLLPVRPE